MKTKNKRFLIIFFFIVFFIVGYVLVFCFSPKNHKNNQSNNFLPLAQEKAQTDQGKNEVYTKNILFVGDIMLDRGVEQLMKKNTFSYPFQNISQFLKTADFVSGNLEGPIVNQPTAFSMSSLRFAFAPEITSALSSFGFDLFSLANNHTLDMGQGGLEETKELLKKEGINFFGDPLDCTKNFLYQEGNLIYFGFNKTFPFNCSDQEIFAVIQETREDHQEAFIIANVHWGEEYQKNNNAIQQKTAHQLIDAGADLIVGHHPHVVQNIEAYKNKLIFYSLGNFIFDQYFSLETQQGLAVKLEIYPAKVVYRLFPIQSRLSQPFLMGEKETITFLNVLAQKSSPELTEQIKNGSIEIANKK